MADKRIQDLTPASSVQLNDLFVLEQSGAAKNLTGQILVNDLATYLDGHGGIANIVYAPPVAPSLNGTMTIIMADETEYTLTVTNGNGITGITWQESGTPGDGQTHTGTIRYTNGTTSTVVINDGLRGYTGAQTYVWFKWSQNYPTQDSDLQNNVAPYIGIYAGTSSTAPTTYTSYTWYQYKGEKGDTGDSVESIQKTGTSGLVDTYTVYLTGGVAVGTFTVTNAKSIASFVQTSGTHAAGTTDTYTMTFNDGDSTTISVYNGANGLGAVSTVSGIQADGNGDVPQVVSGNGAPTPMTEGQENQLYYDLNSGSMYYCAGESQGSYIWLGATVTVDSALSTSSTNPVQNKVITGKVGTQTLNTTATDLSGAVNEILTEIPLPQTTGTPANLGTASRGSALTYSRSDHVHNLPSGLVPTGGTTGQFLAKSSGSDYALTWANGTAVYVGADTPTDPNVDIWLDTDEPGQSAVTSVNGANGTVVLDADDVGAMSEWTLLWTNASPTSSFAAQTVSLDLSGYDVIAVVFTGENGNGRRMLFSLIDGNEYASNFVTIASGTVYTKQRLYSPSSTGIQFGGNYQNGSSGTNDTQNVPTAIYGIKGVQIA